MARRFTIDDWQQRLNFLNQPVIIIGKRKEDKKEIFTIQCCKCGNTFNADRKSLYTACYLRERGNYNSDWCPICNKNTVVKGINDVATLRKDLIKFFDNPSDAQQNGIGSHTRVTLRCPKCNQTKSLQVSDLCAKGFHCDYCNDNLSLGEKIIRNLILQLPVEEYDFEFCDSWTQKKRYDVYFKYQNIKYLIEIDGEQHIKNTSWSTLDHQKNNDGLKTELAKQNGFKLIRIKAYRTNFDYIKQNIVESQLSAIFELSHIDWDEIYNQTVTSRNIEMAKYYMEHKDMMLKDIANHFHVSSPTLKKALIKLTRIGFCDYTKEEAFLNGRRKNGLNMIKDNAKFHVYSPDNIDLGEYLSAKNCYQALKTEFDKYGINRRKIDALLFKGESYKGFRFVYENGLYEHHKSKHPYLFEICDLFNSGKSVKEISLMKNISTAKVYSSLIAGTNMGICSYKKRDDRKVV